MEADLKRIRELFEAATERVGRSYFHQPVASNRREGAVTQYRERVYCYELYHQWRCGWPEELPYKLCGEVDKSGHPLIRIKKKPDFLVHVPGFMRNLLAVEVKSVAKVSANLASGMKDLNTLSYFRADLDALWSDSNYRAAFWLVYGLSSAQWPKLRDDLRRQAGANWTRWQSIVCYVHPAPGVKAEPVSWE